MNDLTIPQGFGAVAPVFQNTAGGDELSAGVQRGFGVVGYKGKVWSIRFRGEEHKLMREDGDGPRGSIEVVITRASGNLSKVFYEKGYVDGSTEAPDCFSTNGVTPDPSATKRQSSGCANCPRNAWGSRISESGAKGKACSDSKRLAVSPLNDLANDVFGGPMLLRVPAASLGEMATFADRMKKLGYPYYSFATRIAFDSEEAYPKFVFSPIRPLTAEEGKLILEQRDSEQVIRILSEGSEIAAPATGAQASPFEQPAPAGAPLMIAAGQNTSPGNVVTLHQPQQVQAPVQPVQTAAVLQPQTLPVQTTSAAPQVQTLSTAPATAPTPADFEAELDRQLEDLLPKT